LLISSKIAYDSSGLAICTISTLSNGSAYSYQLVATDDSGTAPIYSLVSGTFPTGITLSSSGLISGTTSAITGSTGTISLTFRATDANSTFTDQSLSIPTQIYEFSSFTFTNAGVVGSSGPTLAQVRSAYSGASWAQNSSYLNVVTQGYQEWTVPTTGSYTIEARGAAGGDGSPGVFGDIGTDRGFNTNFAGGYGTGMKGTFNLTVGDIYVLVVGQRGRTGTGNSNTAGGGGGGTFVWKKSDLSLAVAAGGGGGSQCNSNYWATAGSYIHATTSTTGQTSGAGRAGGSNGGAGTSENNGVVGYNGSGGAGWLGEPAYSAGTPARSRTNGFRGGVPSNNGTFGGFGGGGAPGDDGRIDVINVIPFGYDFFLDDDLIAGEGYSELVSVREVVMDISAHIIESLPINWMDNHGGAGRIVICLDNHKIKFDIMCHEWDVSEGLVFHKTLTCE
jgi:hypothetical protein